MPTLCSTVIAKRAAAGFELPVFRENVHGNSDLIQVINERGKISDFQTCHFPREATEKVEMKRYVEVGDDALWAFRSSRKVFIGTETELQAHGLQLLEDGELDDTPLLATEMARFCRAEERFLSKFKQAFHFLKTSSEESANTWRDAVVLLPLIREDIASFISRKQRRLIQGIFAVSEGSITTILVPSEIADSAVKLTSFQKIAPVFGVRDFKILPMSDDAEKRETTSNWDVLGVGGFACHAIIGRSLRGTGRPPTATGKLVARATDMTAEPRRPLHKKQLFIGVTGSDLDSADYVSAASDGLVNYEFKHILNIRPVGFGTPSKKKATPEQLRDRFSKIDMMWLLTAHRLRQTGTYTNHMSTMHVISRNLIASIEALTGALSSQRGLRLLGDFRKTNGIGVIALSKYIEKNDDDTNLKRLVYNMLSEDVLLHTARSIQVFWPLKKSSTFAPPRTVELGERSYKVEVIFIPNSARVGRLVGLAANVSQAARTPHEFRDFCISLFAGYGWWVARKSEKELVFNSVHGVITAHPILKTGEILQKIAAAPTIGADQLLITNQTVSLRLRQRANASGWDLIHYSELGRWMKSKFSSYLIGDVVPD